MLISIVREIRMLNQSSIQIQIIVIIDREGSAMVEVQVCLHHRHRQLHHLQIIRLRFIMHHLMVPSHHQVQHFLHRLILHHQNP